MRDLYSVRTPENVSFEFELAGPAQRAAAWALDLAVMGGLYVGAMLVAGALGLLLGGLATALYFVMAFVIQWGYGALTEWRWSGQTVGKRLLGLRVMATAGTPVTLLQAVVRNLLRVVDLLPGLYLVGGTSMLLDHSLRRLGDVAAGTVVVRQRRTPRPSTVVAEVDRYNSFVSDPSVVHATSRISAPERDVMVGLAVRRESLPLAVRYALFSKLAEHLSKRLRLDRPAFFSEERFVLNLTSVALGLGSDPRTTGLGSREATQ